MTFSKNDAWSFYLKAGALSFFLVGAGYILNAALRLDPIGQITKCLGQNLPCMGTHQVSRQRRACEFVDKSKRVLRLAPILVSFAL